MLLDAPTPDTPRPPEPRRRTLDNPRTLVGLALLLVAILLAMFWLPGRVGRLEETLDNNVILYALASVNLTMLVAILFVLGRNIVKLVVERRRGEPFARFRAKMVAALLAMTIIPASLVLIIGSQFLRTSADRWFSVPVDEALESAQIIAAQYYRERREAVRLRADRLSTLVPPGLIESGDVSTIAGFVRGELSTMRDGLVEVYQTVPTATGERDAVFLLAQQVGTPPPDAVRASADRLAARVAATGTADVTEDNVPSGGYLVRAGAPVRNAAGVVVGVIVTSLHVSQSMAADARRATDAYEQWRQLRVSSGLLQGVTAGFFLMIALLILTAATWMGFYIAKRITRPVQMLAEGARAIGAGHLDMRIEPETSDELGSLVEAFNSMAAELGSSQERLEHSRQQLAERNVEVESRRRYIETVLERVATGVVSLDAAGHISTMNGAAMRLLALDASAIGTPVTTVMSRDDLQALLPLVTSGVTRAGGIEEITITRPDGEVHLAAAATALVGTSGAQDGVVIVLDDVTPLIRTQRVAAWRDVARRLAHEIKNPLTPIQLSAERLRRNFASAPPNAKALVDECTGAIITEVDALKGLVDEFAQFARLRGPRMAPADLNAIVSDTLTLYVGVLQQGTLRIEPRLAQGVPLVRVDAEQMRQVIINLIDNAMEALGGPSGPPRPDGQPPTIVIATAVETSMPGVALTVTDNGPGVPAADRDKLFMPYYSTKGRGSGLGLAIVQRIIAEHGGRIDVGDGVPSGAVVTVVLPAE
ncbi:MAG: HAMP domain-containing protein [Acidobacteria bacterium]|nr:HAMP domain-containing protein [Acidobacteriota bacterium]